MLNLQIAEYERQNGELAHDIDEAKRQKAAEFEPYAKELQKDVDDITSTIEQQKASIQKMDSEKKECISSIQDLQEVLKGPFTFGFVGCHVRESDRALCARRPGGAKA